MDHYTINELFYPTLYYKSSCKESTSELRDCFEQYYNTYISAPDFIQNLKDLGFSPNQNEQFKLRMKKHIRRQYFGN